MPLAVPGLVPAEIGQGRARGLAQAPVAGRPVGQDGRAVAGGRRGGADDDVAGLGQAARAAGVGRGQADVVGAGGGIGVAGRLGRGGRAVTEGPGPARRRVGRLIGEVDRQRGLAGGHVGAEGGHRGRWRRGGADDDVAGLGQAARAAGVGRGQADVVGAGGGIGVAGRLGRGGRAVTEGPGPAGRRVGRLIGEVDRQRGLAGGHVGAEGGHRGRWRRGGADDDVAGLGQAARAAGVGRGQADVVGAGGGIGVAGRLGRGGRAVTEGPGPARRRVGRLIGEVDRQRGLAGGHVGAEGGHRGRWRRGGGGRVVGGDARGGEGRRVDRDLVDRAVEVVGRAGPGPADGEDARVRVDRAGHGRARDRAAVDVEGHGRAGLGQHEVGPGGRGGHQVRSP